MSIKSSVGAPAANGRRAENLPDDVTYIRALLNFHIFFNPSFHKEKVKPLPIPMFVEKNMDETIRAIKVFQMYELKAQQPTGRIEPRDPTIKALVLGDVPGMPKAETLAPFEDRYRNKLLRIIEDDFLSFYDHNGEIRNMIDMLLKNPNADDRYLRHMYLRGDTEVQDPRMEDYIEKQIVGVTTPGPVDFFCSVKARIKEEGMSLPLDGLTRLVARIAGEIRVGYSGYFVCDAKHALNLSPSTTGPKAASDNIDTWFKTQFANANSIYHCFPSILKDTEYH